MTLSSGDRLLPLSLTDKVAADKFTSPSSLGDRFVLAKTADGVVVPVKVSRLARYGMRGFQASLTDAVTLVSIGEIRGICTGGVFTESVSGVSMNNVGVWNAGSWNSLGYGLNARVYALVTDADKNIYAGGNFTESRNDTMLYISKWDGANWNNLGSGLNNQCYALALDSSGNLYAGGRFTSAGGVPVNYIAKWDGENWSALGTGLSGFCRTLAFDSSGNLYAGGSFATAGGVTVNNIAKWDGANWSALGAGLQKSGFIGHTGGYSYAIGIDSSDNIFVGGQFDKADGQTHYTIGDETFYYKHIAMWDGANWIALGWGVNDWCRALAIDIEDNVYAGGDFVYVLKEQPTPNVTVNYIAKWDGANWSALGTGLSGSCFALALDSAGDLYAGGSFATAGGVTVNNIATWDGLSFGDLDGGISGTQYALTNPY